MSSATATAREATWGLTHTGRLAYLEERFGVAGSRPTRRQRVKRAMLYVLLTWAAPCALSFVPHDGSLAMPFALDIEAHVRGLVAIPLLLFAEWPIEQRLRAVMRRLGSPPLTPRGRSQVLSDRIHWARRLAGQPLAEGVLLALAFAVGYRWLREHEVGIATWISTPHDGAYALTPAGAWEGAVVVPIYSFLLLRWVWRWVVLALLFGRIARLPLRLVPNHGDRAAGLGFVSEAAVVFSWVLMASSCVVCAKGMDAIIFAGVRPRDFVPTLQVVAAVGVAWAFLPLLAFLPRLVAVKRQALRRYSTIVARHGVIVERRWLSSSEDLVSADDAESMANLNSVREAVQGIRFVPTGLTELIVVAAAALLPLTPIIAQIIPARELASKLVQALV